MESPAPRTNVGRWLRAILLGDQNHYARLGQRLNGGKKGWNDDEPAVVEAACELAARRFFGSAAEESAIAALVSDMRTRIAARKPPPEQLDMEAAIRAALGEKGQGPAGVKPIDLFNIRTTLVAEVSDRLALTGDAINELISSAETVAFERGWHPPLAARAPAGPGVTRETRRP